MKGLRMFEVSMLFRLSPPKRRANLVEKRTRGAKNKPKVIEIHDAGDTIGRLPAVENTSE
jgi:hypothetical protein